MTDPRRARCNARSRSAERFAHARSRIERVG